MTAYDHDLQRGLRNRRSVLGDAWVDRSLNGATALTAEFQGFISRYAWHEVWGRPGLDHRTRRIIVLAITTALGRWEEFQLHIRAALTGGDPASRLTVDDIKEVLIQSAIYAGVPAANTAFAETVKILRELGQEFAPWLEQLDVHTAAHPGVGASRFTTTTPSLHYTVREPRNGRAPRRTIVLSHALGCDVMMWDHLANVLAWDHRVVCYDHRGHGLSEVPPGPYTMQDLCDDAARLIDEVGGPVTFIGLSMGGMVGQELALQYPDKVEALVLANTTSGYPAEAQAGWAQRIAAIQSSGLDGIVDGAMQRWFHDGFRAAQPATVARWRQRVVTCDARGYIATCQAISQIDTTGRLGQLKVPVLVIAGELDIGTPPAMAKTIAQAAPGATLVVLPEASHLSVLEQPESFTACVRDWLAGLA